MLTIVSFLFGSLMFFFSIFLASDIRGDSKCESKSPKEDLFLPSIFLASGIIFLTSGIKGDFECDYKSHKEDS